MLVCQVCMPVQLTCTWPVLHSCHPLSELDQLNEQISSANAASDASNVRSCRIPRQSGCLCTCASSPTTANSASSSSRPPIPQNIRRASAEDIQGQVDHTGQVRTTGRECLLLPCCHQQSCVACHVCQRLGLCASAATGRPETAALRVTHAPLPMDFSCNNASEPCVLCRFLVRGKIFQLLGGGGIAFVIGSATMVGASAAACDAVDHHQHPPSQLPCCSPSTLCCTVQPQPVNFVLYCASAASAVQPQSAAAGVL